MRCPNCNLANRDERRFCAGCGTQLRQCIVCTDCGFPNYVDESFCGGCGAQLPAGSAETSKTLSRRSEIHDSDGAERRQVTVMFCDLVNSTALSKFLDPEDLREIVAHYREACSRIIDEYEGHIGHIAGDGLLVYFGYPRAHEDDAQRGVQAGLAIVEAVRQLSERYKSKAGEIRVRVGITTGVVVAGEIGSGPAGEKMGIVGETPNLAARLEAVAPPNSVVVGASTFELVEGLFVFEELGAKRVKGFSEPILVYEVLRRTDIPSRFEASARRGLTPLVGRAEEIGLLAKRWEQAKDGEAQVVMISGEPGIGKSRLLKGFQQRIDNDLQSRVSYYCSPLYTNTAFYPSIMQITRAFHLEENDSNDEKLEKIQSNLAQLDLGDPETTGIFASLLSLNVEEHDKNESRSASQLRAKTLEAHISLLHAISAQSPLLMIVEDAQWIDPSTKELLNFLIDRSRTWPLLILITFRPEFRHSWADYANVSTISLTNLSRKESEAMIFEVTQRVALPQEVVTQIVRKTDGVPLFVEELTKAMTESDLLKERHGRYVLKKPLPPLSIPASIHDSLMARLDRLLPVKHVAQLAAVIGRTFDRKVLAAVSHLDDAELENALTELAAAGLIFVLPGRSGVVYEFKHALVADAAYQSLLRSTQQKYHRQVAEELERQFPDIARLQPELLAHHYTDGHVPELAAKYWELAGKAASQRSANSEAVAHISKGLDQLALLPESEERDRKELDLRIALNGPIIAAKGYSAPDLEENFTQSLELCERVGDVSQTFPVLYAKWVNLITTGKAEQGVSLAQEFLERAKRQEHLELIMIGHRLIGAGTFITGQLKTAQRELEAALELYDVEKHKALTVLYGQDIGAATLCYLALTLWHQGHPGRAMKVGHEVLAHAERLGHAHTLGNAIGHAGAFLHLLNGEDEAAQKYAERLLDYAIEHELPVWKAAARFYLGWAYMLRGKPEQSIDLMQSGLDGLRMINFIYWQPLVLARLAQAYEKLDRFDDGMNCVQEAKQIVATSGESWNVAELYRIEATLLHNHPLADDRKAEDTFWRAIEVARRQEAKQPELRATKSLSSLLLRQGRKDEAAQLLAPLCDWFPEDSNNSDLKQAKALLAKLG